MSFPTNEIESLLLDVTEDRVDVGTFLTSLLDRSAWIPLSAADEGAREIRPVQYEGKPYVRVFTSEERAREVLPDHGLLEINPGRVLQQGPHEWGLAINPGTPYAFTVGSATVHAIVDAQE